MPTLNRTFHARITATHFLFVALVASVALFGLWNKELGAAVFGLGLLTLTVERLIHTTYTLTPQGTLRISRGRFSRTKTIRVADVCAVEQVFRLRMGRRALVSYVLLRFRDSRRCEALMPADADSFVRLMRKMMGDFQVC